MIISTCISTYEYAFMVVYVTDVKPFTHTHIHIYIYREAAGAVLNTHGSSSLYPYIETKGKERKKVFSGVL
jgi:hypothetical protein